MRWDSMGLFMGLEATGRSGPGGPLFARFSKECPGGDMGNKPGHRVEVEKSLRVTVTRVDRWQRGTEGEGGATSDRSDCRSMLKQPMDWLRAWWGGLRYQCAGGRL